MRTKLAVLPLMMIAACGGADATFNGDNGALAAVAPASTSSGGVPPGIADALVAWSKCRADKIRDLIGTPRSDEDIVDEGMRQCLSFEEETKRQWERYYGANTADQLQGLRAQWRKNAITQVNEIRTGKPETGGGDPARLWSICIRHHFPDPLPTESSSESIVDTAMNACSPDMEKYRAYVAQQYGAGVAKAQVEQLRLTLRKLAIELVENSRFHQ